MRKRMAKTMVFMAVVLAMVLGTALPAFACGDGGSCPPPSGTCLNPRGNHAGWNDCGSGLCENPRGAANGWVACSDGVSCSGGGCRIPRGKIKGWVPCTD